MIIDPVKQEGNYIRSLAREEAIHYIAWRYRRVREVHRAHNMTDAEIDKVAIEQYERIMKNE